MPDEHTAILHAEIDSNRLLATPAALLLCFFSVPATKDTDF